MSDQIINQTKFPLPNVSDIWTIYSINPCPYCRKAKELLTTQGEKFALINCNDYKKNNREEFLQFICDLTQTEHKTFPIIFHEGKFIGGYDKLCIYYEDHKMRKQLVETDDF
jgi:glutaredoxin